MNFYYAFGYNIASDFNLPQIPEKKFNQAADISIRKAVFDNPDIDADYFEENDIRFGVENVGIFRITGGNLIEVYPLCDDYNHIAVFIMGSCMGAVIHQRGELPLHGSCITNDEHTVLITGDSGAGKSTLAAEFIKRGWKLLTDDVAVIRNIEPFPVVQPSYPSQKLWKDSMNRFDIKTEEIHSLYSRENEKKYGVNVESSFCDEPHRLTLVIRLIKTDAPTSISRVEGFAKVNQLMVNTYRPYMIMKDKLQRHFQRCVTMSGLIDMALVIRNENEQTGELLYEMITDYLRGNHE